MLEAACTGIVCAAPLYSQNVNNVSRASHGLSPRTRVHHVMWYTELAGTLLLYPGT